MSVTWEATPFKGDPPVPRSGHTLNVVGPSARAWLFGGCGRKNGEAQAFNDLFLLDMGTSDMLRWEEINIAGPKPLPRSRHTAITISKDKLLIFGGLNHRTRYNDVWILDCTNKKWIQPEIKGKCPTPRAHCSATLINNHVYIFGGYKGYGQASGDLWVLDLGDEETPMSWGDGPLNTKGKKPAPRFDHTSSYFPEKLVIFGGRDNAQIFNEMCFLDLETLTWEEDPAKIPPAFAHNLCNHCSDAIESVPNYKMFAIMGKKGMMEFTNTVDVMDCGNLVWTTPTCNGAPPPPREDTCMTYDSKTCRLVFYGGWANRWLGDLWTLNVSPIIGPPYACMRVVPDIGPVFGESEIEVHGISFRSAGKIEVRFGSGKNEITVDGTFVDEGVIKCMTPNYEAFGAMEVDVRINISGDGWTVNKVKFKYFANTSAKNTMAFGPGLLEKGVYGVEMPFLILAKDTCNAKRTSGGDPFVIEVVSTDGKMFGESRVIDLENGMHEGYFSAPAPGTYHVHVKYDELGDPPELVPIRGSPWTVVCEDPWQYHRVGGTAPLKRKDVTTSAIGDKLMLYGGDMSLTPTLLTTGDEWKWVVPEMPEAVDPVVTEGEDGPTTGPDTAPPPRKLHSAVVFGENVAVFGGLSLKDNNEKNDLWILKHEGDVPQWIACAEQLGYVPKPRPKVQGGKPAGAQGEAAEGEAPAEGEAAEGEAPAEGEEAAPADAEAKPEGEAAEGEAKPEGEAAEGEAKPEGEAAEGEAKPEGEAAEGEAKPEGEAAEGEAKPEGEGGEAAAEGEAKPEEEELTGGGGDPVVPMARSDHGCVALEKNKVLIFGGDNAGDLLDDIAVVDLSDPTQPVQWDSPNVKNVYPMSRRGTSMAYFKGKLFIFSGKRLDEDDEEYLINDFLVGEIKDNTLAITEVPLEGICPPPRTRAIFQLYGPNKIMLHGGLDKSNKPINDAWLLDTVSHEWTKVYQADPELLPAGGAVAAIVKGQIVSISSGAGSARFDVVKTLDPFAILSGYDFTKRMVDESTAQMEYLETFVNTVEEELALASPVETLSENFDKLLKVMHALFEVRTKKNDITLLIDSLHETYTTLTAKKQNCAAKEAKLNKLEERWGEIMKQAPTVKAEVQPVQDVEGERIRSEIVEFSQTLDTYKKDLEGRKIYQYEHGYMASYTDLLAYSEEQKAMWKELDDKTGLANMFEFPEDVVHAKDVISECKEDLVFLKDVWDTCMLTELQFKKWEQTLWSEIQTDAMEDGTKSFVKEVKGLPKKIRTTKAYVGLDASVKNFLTSIPLVADLRSDCMRDRHWRQLMDTTKVEVAVKDPGFKLADLLKLELFRFEDEVGEIVDRAQKEEKMEQSLAKLEEVWGKVEWIYQQHKDTDVQMCKIGEEDFEILEDNQVLVQGMMANRYMATFQDAILGWNKKLMMVADVNQILSEIQRTWAYLESLFIHSEEVKKELPEAAERFKKIDTEVKRVLKSAVDLKNVVETCCQDGLYKNLEQQQKELEICEKALADYMESKRRAFPRFYFVSTADLLDILSNGNNPVKVMPHMSKCFQAIGALTLDTQNPPAGTRPKALAMVSCVGQETIDLKTPMGLEGKVEQYMMDFINKMRGELRMILDDSNKAYPNKARPEWVGDWPSQLVLVVNQIYWCAEVEEAFGQMGKGDKDAMKTYNERQVGQLKDLIDKVRTKLEKPQRQKAMNMITIDAHSRDIIQNIVESGASEVTSFDWQAQLRTYWNPQIDDCEVKICDAIFPYGYEYLGNGGRLVITPLTDRIYVTATQACWLSLGCAPAGPAGTGKTESTKDLSAQLGKSIYVFNCAPEMDYRTMGDIFKGLAASGSWGCFDEFNRLVPEVLSVCSVQYKCVTDAQKRKTLLPGRGLEYMDKEGNKVPAITDYKFVASDGVEMPLEEGTSAFITMNPGYIGRAELPESLKALFRPITVMVPDRQLIMENMLMAEGFVEAKILAKKFATLYYLLEDLLSPQKHYDWGLRAINSVLKVAGVLLRASEGQLEVDVLFRALRDFNIPKIITDDMVIFMGLLNDLFPGTDPPRARDEVFEEVIVETCINMGLHNDEDFILRVVQLSELLAIRHCVFLMGPTGVGRTEAYRCLCKSMEKGTDAPTNTYLTMFNKHKTIIRDINPKAVSTQELYGYVNLATREWKDGLLSYTMRDLARMSEPEPVGTNNSDPKWIMLDGDLDANWIESMNSVMDDNKLLTLPSNERISVKPDMRLVFEIRDLKFATPATATRAGILYISEVKQWNNMVQSWLKRVVPPYAEKAKWKDPSQPLTWMTELFERYTGKCVFEMKKSYNHLTPLATMNLVSTTCAILESVLKPENINNKADQSLFEMYFVFAMVWGFGGALAPKDGIEYRKNFDKWWKGAWTAVRFPGKGSIYDYYVNPKTGKFTPWADTVQEVEFDSTSQNMSSVFVPTPETAALMFFLDAMVAIKKPIMFVGGAGFGKTQLVKGKLSKLPEGMISQAISFNYFTDVVSFQKILEAQLEKKAGINYGPPGQNTLVYFVDDLNMPKLDPYDTAMPISHIRQHLGWGHWFDRAKLTQKNIHNTQYVACMNPTAGSFIVNPRLQRLFMTLSMDFPGQDSLMAIFGTFLNGHLKQFSDDCKELGTKILQAALALHDKVANTFRKTAINFHYEFTVRHLSNVFMGLLMSTPEFFNDPIKISRLWLHESERVYADRLVSLGDLKTYNKSAEAIAKKFFKIPDIEAYYKANDTKPLIFSHFAGGLGDKIYNEVETFEGLQKILEEALNEYNETNALMDLVLFEDAMKHVCRISRIISNTGGHALLVGVGGSGKQSLSKLASHICGFSTYMIVISSSYSTSNLREDLQKMYKRSGVKGEGITFLFTDSQITDERFLVFINDLLSSGEIPDLFPVEDKDEIINAMRGEVKGAGLMDTRDNCWDFFINKVRENLHMVFTCSPVGEQFRIRAQRFPAMVTSTVIDWFQPWPEKSLLSVAARFLADTDLGDDTIRNAVVEFMPFSFGCVNLASKQYFDIERRYNYTTPKTFLELIKLYKSLLNNKRTSTQNNIDRLENGLTKLKKTQQDVDILVEEAKVMSVAVEEKVAASDAFAEKVGEEKQKVGLENDAAAVEAAKCEQIAVEVAEKQASCEKDLAAAEPLVAQAEAALDTLNKKDLGEAKSLKKPPAGVDDITAAVMTLLDNPKDKSWQAATKMMNNVDKFLDRLKGYKALIDEQKVPTKHFKDVRPYLALEHFDRDIIYGKSRAAAGLCEWVLNIVMYYDVVSEVEPKRQELAEANAKLAAANETLTEVKEKVARLNEMVADLERQFKEATDEKNAAIAESERCQKRLDLANRLINALGSEGERWEVSVADLKNDYSVLTGDMLLAAAFVSYTGCFTAKFRKQLVKECYDFCQKNTVPMTKDADPLSVLVDEAVIAGWVGEGLPSDRTSVENGTIVTNSERWPLMIDPQLQGIAWIKERESKNNLQVVRMGAPKTVATMEKAIEAGHSVLIENMAETIDAVLSPVITRSTFKKGRSMYVKLGDKEVEYSPKFRLFLHTKLSNPHYPPEIQAETTLINFTVTEAGLEDQLLALVVNKERPDLEETKTNLIIQNNEFTIKLKELEDGLLAKLAAAEGDLTEDVELIESLEESKRVAEEINIQVAAAKETQINIDIAREKYRNVATRGSLLFFMLNSLNKIHAFYQFSLNAFVTVFARGIDLTPGGKKAKVKLSFRTIAKRVMGKFDWNMDLLSTLIPSKKGKPGKDARPRTPAEEPTPEELEKRLKNLTDTCTYTVFNYTRRGLFDRDKLIVSSLLTMLVMLKDGLLDPDDYELLLKGPKNLQPPPITDELSNWMSESQWSALDPVNNHPPFKGLCKDMEKNSDEWRDWSELEACERKTMPGEWSKLAPFRQLLIIRAIRPDRITSALEVFVDNSMGSNYVNQDAFSAGTMMEESGPSTPIFFILFPGYSPSKEIEILANSLGKTVENRKLTIISMGQGQEKPAEGVLDKYTKEGGWVFLDNVHLMQGWVPALERKLEVAAESAHKDFRCFFSAEPINGAPHAKIIPESILQTCIKISNEPPSDMKSNLRRSLAAFTQEIFDRPTTDKKRAAFRSIAFGLCFYHSLLLGRKKFGVGVGTGAGSGLGFCRGYSFNMGDLSTCGDVLYNYLEANEEVPWADLRYMFGEVFYGGHITDAMDRRCCTTYLEVLLQPTMLPGPAGEDGNLTPPTLELIPGFKAPIPGDIEMLRGEIENNLPAETPVLYGLHPNAQLQLMTTQGETLFTTIVDVSGGGGGGGGGGGSKKEDTVRAALTGYLEGLAEEFNMVDIESRVVDKTPYVVCALQEATRMNSLTSEIRRSLQELELGLDGALNMSASMEALSDGLFNNRVPGTWMAQMSTRFQEVYNLAQWMQDVANRIEQLTAWTAGTIVMPNSIWLPGLFNAKAFLTAVQQTYARANKLPLDMMKFMTDVTTKSIEQITEPCPDGAYIHGFVMEGARWDSKEGIIKDSIPKELHPAMPVMVCRPVTSDQYDLTGYYVCPVYANMQRANVYSPQVSAFTLKTKDPPFKWTLASVGLLLQDDLA